MSYILYILYIYVLYMYIYIIIYAYMYIYIYNIYTMETLYIEDLRKQSNITIKRIR